MCVWNANLISHLLDSQSNYKLMKLGYTLDRKHFNLWLPVTLLVKLRETNIVTQASAHSEYVAFGSHSFFHFVSETDSWAVYLLSIRIPLYCDVHSFIYFSGIFSLPRNQNNKDPTAVKTGIKDVFFNFSTRMSKFFALKGLYASKRIKSFSYNTFFLVISLLQYLLIHKTGLFHLANSCIVISNTWRRIWWHGHKPSICFCWCVQQGAHQVRGWNLGGIISSNVHNCPSAFSKICFCSAQS